MLRKKSHPPKQTGLNLLPRDNTMARRRRGLNVKRIYVFMRRLSPPPPRVCAECVKNLLAVRVSVCELPAVRACTWSGKERSKGSKVTSRTKQDWRSSWGPDDPRGRVAQREPLRARSVLLSFLSSFTSFFFSPLERRSNP